jgi:hypothetical protein
MKGRQNLISDCHFCLFWNMPKIMPKRGNSHIFIIERKVNEGHTDRHGSALMTPNVGERICIPILSITADYYSRWPC